MKEENTKEGLEKNKNNRKIRKRVKRQVSIFTVMLWLFLIATMIWVTVNSTKKTNALEVEDENWNIQLVMYDRSSDTPEQAITEFTWNAVKGNEAKQLCMQINYACTTNKGYAPGEIEITIPGFAKDSFSEYWRNYDKYSREENGGEWLSFYEYWLKNNVVIAADKISDTNKKYDWSYSYDNINNMYTFINNNQIAENEHFEGTVQIVYNLFSRFKIKTDLEFIAKIKENMANVEEIIVKESNSCNIHYTATKRVYELSKKAEIAPRIDYTPIEDIVDNYYWIKYEFEISFSSDDVIGCENCRVIDELPEGCVVYNNSLEKLEPFEGNKYEFEFGYFSRYYIGYPKSKYNKGDSITNTAELWGRYEDEEEIQKLAEGSRTVVLKELDYTYNGDLYSITKLCNEIKYLSEIKRFGGSVLWRLSNFVAFHTGGRMDVEIGDEQLYITRKNGDVTKLNDDEYNFTQLKIPVFYTYNRYTGNPGNALVGYNYEIQVRYKDTSDYIVYTKKTLSDKTKYDSTTQQYYQDIISFYRNDIVGIKVVIRDLDKTLYCNYGNSGWSRYIGAVTNVNTEDCDVGVIQNFTYLKVYNKDEDGNIISVNESKKSNATADVKDGLFSLSASKTNKNLVNNVKKEKYEINYEMATKLNLVYYDVDKDCIIKQYDILPSGMNLASSKEEIINSLTTSFPYEKLKLKDGTKFANNDELNDFIKKNTTVDIDYNYRESGRTKVSIIYNLNDIDWTYYLTGRFSESIFAKINVEIPYDSIFEYGTKYTNYIYTMWNNQEYLNGGIADSGKYDSLANDIDNDGNTEEYVDYYSDTLNITHAVSSQQAVIKQVRTDLTKGNFIEGTAEATAGSEYTYKLRVTTGANSLKDLIIYDTLETIYDENGNDISSGWKGEFLNVDTSYAVSKGYAPVVYYSEEQNPGKLTEVPDKWKILTEDTDKSTVKSICVDLRYKVDGTEMELSPNNVVFVLINMQAPSDGSLLTSANNMFRTNWRAIDPFGTVIDNVEGIYSNQVNVEIHKEDIRTNISGTKTWKDEDNKYDVRPESITVKLLQDGVEYETKTVTSEDNWNYTFENIPVYKSNTSLYEYEIVEENVDNYITEYDGNNITNKVNKTEVKVEKVWDDNENESLKRTESVKVNLLKNSEVIDSIVLNSENEWKHTFTDLQKYDESGNEIVYTVDEEITSEFYIKEIVGGKITNRFVVPKDRIKLVGRKLWEDEENIAGKRPDSIVLQVKAGDKVVTEAEVSDKNNWSYEFELAKYDSLGNEIEYYIDEKDSGNKFYEKIESEEKNTVANKFVVPEEKVEIWVNKVWVDENNKYGKRPSSIILQVKNNGKVVKEAEVSLSDEWRYKFELPKYDSLGNEIEYTVDEREINEGDLKYYNKEIKGNEIVNTNTYEEVTDTSDINIFVYVAIFFIAIIGIIIGIIFVRKNKVNKK